MIGTFGHRETHSEAQAVVAGFRLAHDDIEIVKETSEGIRSELLTTAEWLEGILIEAFSGSEFRDFTTSRNGRAVFVHFGGKVILRVIPARTSRDKPGSFLAPAYITFDDYSLESRFVKGDTRGENSWDQLLQMIGRYCAYKRAGIDIAPATLHTED